MTVLVVCGPAALRDSGNGPPLATIKSEAALKLVMPGSQQVGAIDEERANTIEGQFAASDGAEFDTTADQASIFAYYERELAGLGWIRDQPPILTTVEAAGRAWCKPRMIFRVSVFDPQPAALRGIVVPAGRTRYRAVIVGTDGACPRF